MILGDVEIRRALARGEIVVRPMAPWAIQSNSIDLHLAPTLLVYTDIVLRTDRACPTREVHIDPIRGLCLHPGELYLGVTVEHTDAGPCFPVVEGTSGAGRLGLTAHVTAGQGDVGYAGHWTLELTVVKPVWVFGGEPIAQITFWLVHGRVGVPYGQKPAASYADAREAGAVPHASRMWRKPRWTGDPETSGSCPQEDHRRPLYVDQGRLFCALCRNRCWEDPVSNCPRKGGRGV